MSADLMKIAEELEHVMQWESNRMGAVSAGSMRAMIRTLKEGSARSERGALAQAVAAYFEVIDRHGSTMERIDAIQKMRRALDALPAERPGS